MYFQNPKGGGRRMRSLKLSSPPQQVRGQSELHETVTQKQNLYIFKHVVIRKNNQAQMSYSNEPHEVWGLTQNYQPSKG